MVRLCVERERWSNWYFVIWLLIYVSFLSFFSLSSCLVVCVCILLLLLWIKKGIYYSLCRWNSNCRRIATNGRKSVVVNCRRRSSSCCRQIAESSVAKNQSSEQSSSAETKEGANCAATSATFNEFLVVQQDVDRSHVEQFAGKQQKVFLWRRHCGQSTDGGEKFCRLQWRRGWRWRSRLWRAAKSQKWMSLAAKSQDWNWNWASIVVIFTVSWVTCCFCRVICHLVTISHVNCGCALLSVGSNQTC